MAENTEADVIAGGVAFDDYFESIGKKAAGLSLEEQNGQPKADVADTEDADEQKIVDEIESLCMNCHANGITRLLLTRIPYFREIIIMSFYCPHCSFKNSEIQSAGEIQQKGARYELRLTTMPDFSRQLVKSDTCVVKFIELDLEVPAGRGQLTNVEGLLSMVLEDLAVGQEQRKIQLPEVYTKVDEIITKGKEMIAGNGFPFRLSVDDPAGNSWIEPEQKDGVGKWSKVEYARTTEQNEALGLGEQEEEDSTDATRQPTRADFEDDDIVPNEVYSFPATCPGCNKHCVTHMKMVEIPHFKQVVIMSTVCDHCGYRSNEVKTGGEVPEKGKKITLKVESPTDLARDILKSESCALECPELELSVNPGTLGGRFTTVEGLLTQVRDDLHSSIFDTGDDSGDGQESDSKQRWKEFFARLTDAIEGNRKFTVILKDPLASSYVQNLYLPDDDPQIESEEYDRTEEEEEDLGLTDMKVEGYVDEVGDEKKRVAEEETRKAEEDTKKAEEETKKVEESTK